MKEGLLLQPLFIFLGGGVGALLRFYTTQVSLIFTSKTWVGIFIANITGCFILFLMAKLKIEGPRLDYFMKIGLLGALTTFSTFCFQVVELIKLNNYKEALLVFLLNIFFGIVIGIWLFRNEVL